jgi:hypothetical protein
VDSLEPEGGKEEEGEIVTIFIKEQRTRLLPSRHSYLDPLLGAAACLELLGSSGIEMDARHGSHQHLGQLVLFISLQRQWRAAVSKTEEGWGGGTCRQKPMSTTMALE